MHKDLRHYDAGGDFKVVLVVLQVEVRDQLALDWCHG